MSTHTQRSLRAQQLARQSGIPSNTAADMADQLETLCALARADQPDEAPRLRDCCWRLEWGVLVAIIIGLANFGVSAAQVLA